MKIDSLTKEDLELMSYKDISYIIIEEKGQLNTPQLFRMIADKLEMTEKEYESKIADFYTMLTTDKRFIMIDGNWDLRNNHKSDKIVSVSDDDEDELDENYNKTDDIDMNEEDEEEDYDSENEDDDFDDDDDSLKDLVIVDEDELELEQ